MRRIGEDPKRQKQRRMDFMLYARDYKRFYWAWIGSVYGVTFWYVMLALGAGWLLTAMGVTSVYLLAFVLGGAIGPFWWRSVRRIRMSHYSYQPKPDVDDTQEWDVI